MAKIYIRLYFDQLLHKILTTCVTYCTVWFPTGPNINLMGHKMTKGITKREQNLMHTFIFYSFSKTRLLFRPVKPLLKKHYVNSHTKVTTCT